MFLMQIKFCFVTSIILIALTVLDTPCPVTAEKVKCTDLDSRCPAWAGRGECNNNQRFMLKHCKYSCGQCGEPLVQGIVDMAAMQTYHYLFLLLVFLGGLSIAMVKVNFSGGVCRCKNKLKGQTVIVTGASRGIGYHTALHLAWRGARVILACQSYKGGLQALKEIRKLSKNKLVEFKKLDLASFASIKEFAREICTDEERIDILINNAGISSSNGKAICLTKDGLELIFQVNYLGHFLLTNLLLDKMKKCAPGRIINITSQAYERSKGLDFQNLQGEKSFCNHIQYADSKLALLLFTHELNQRLEGSNVTVNSVYPGAIDTGVEMHVYGCLFRCLYAPINFLFNRSPRMGAQTSIHCSVAEELTDVSGKYFADCKIKDIKPIGKDGGIAKKLWEVSERLAGLA